MPPPTPLRPLPLAIGVVVAAVASSLVHELGHAVFYWIQGIPAAFALTREFPLRSLTAREYAIGAAGGPLFSLLLLSVSLAVQRTRRSHPTGNLLWSALVLANLFYLLFRSLIALLTRSGGELQAAAEPLGAGYAIVVAVFLGLAVAALGVWVRGNAIRVSLRNGLYFLGLLVAYATTAVALQSVDRALLWDRFPTVSIDATPPGR